jgi:hypothetical protein
MDDFVRIYRIGTSRTQGDRTYSIFVEARYKNKRLSLTGVEGPTRDGNCMGGSGQINMNMDITKITPVNGWTSNKIKRLLDIWDEWHLNDMQAACEHQRKNWDTEKEILIYKFRPTKKFWELKKKIENREGTTYEYENYKEIVIEVAAFTWNTTRKKTITQQARDLIDGGWLEVEKTEKKSAHWTRYDEHPEGLLCKPCEVCGYKYGTAWLKKEVPNEILKELSEFPETDIKPAWV